MQNQIQAAASALKNHVAKLSPDGDAKEMAIYDWYKEMHRSVLALAELTHALTIQNPKKRGGGQTKKMSFAESLFNVAVGYGIAVATQIAVFPLFGINIPLHDNLLIGAIFTVVSIARSYLLRRFFNWIQVKKHDFAK